VGGAARERGRRNCLIPDAIIQEIRDRVDIVAVIGRHMELQRSGRTWKGNCVFHGEKTPSFHVYPEDKHFKCYGCDAYGDVFKFLQKLEGKEFPEVVRALAQEVGVEIPEASEEDSAEARARRKERNELTGALDAAARYWAARLQSKYGADARAYLDSRGVSEESRARFRLGVAASAWNDLPPRLKEKGVGLPALSRAGLVIDREKGDGTYDRFRSRLMFPICGIDGQVIGFGGRILPGAAEPGARGDLKAAKYINTPETLLYKKSKVLYGLDLARETIRKTRAAVLVEGYLDVIGLHQVGLTAAVAVCGTALTPEHVELLGRCDCREVTILFDGDPAGLAAPAKAAAALFPAGLAGKVAVLPSEGGKTDPDDYAQAHGRAGVEALLASATPLSEFLIDRAAARSCGPNPRQAPLEGKIAAVRELEPFLRMMPEGLARSVFEDAVARRLDLDPGALKAELASDRRNPRMNPTREIPRAAAPPPPRAPAPRGAGRVQVVLPGPAADALAIFIAFPDLGAAAEEQGLPQLLPAGPLAELARDLIRAPIPLNEALARVDAGADANTARWIRNRAGPGQPPAAAARGALLKAMMKTQVERAELEYDRLIKLAERAASKVPEDLSTAVLAAMRRREDLKKRLSDLEKAG
jgi:DNA primase